MKKRKKKKKKKKKKNNNNNNNNNRVAKDKHLACYHAISLLNKNNNEVLTFSNKKPAMTYFDNKIASGIFCHFREFFC